MSRKSRAKSQSVVVTESPVVVSDVTPIAEATTVLLAEAADAELPVSEVATEEVAAEVAPAEIATAKVKKYPREGGKCWVVWNECDNLVAAGTHPTVKHLRDIATERNWNVSNASQEFYAWRKYHGRK
jgi:hypothetical protein